MKQHEVVKVSDQLGAKISSLWVEKYRPTTLDDIILSDDNRAIFEALRTQHTIPNLLFSGPAGIGKTSLAKIIVKSILKCQYLYINASDESGIDTIRTKVVNFSRVLSLDGQIKIIILDECDGLTQDAQRALRNVMEEYTDHTRFILTANYKHRVIPALQSRCQYFDLTPPLALCIERVQWILEKENVNISDNISAVEKHVKSFYPDLRKGINELQKSSITGELNVRAVTNKFADNIYKILQGGAMHKARQYVIENEERFSSDYGQLLKDIFNYVERSDTLSDDVKREVLIIIAEYMYRSAFVLDQEINFFTCMLIISKQL
jgi:DNA polymerase III delta prime subunit